MSWEIQHNSSDISPLHLIINVFLDVLKAEFKGEITTRSGVSPVTSKVSLQEGIKRKKKKKKMLRLKGTINNSTILNLILIINKVKIVE